MACNDWISCLSDSDDSLPSCSQYLHSQKKSHDSDIGGYKSLTQRLEKTNERIDVVGSSGTLQSITSAKHTNIVVQKETKKARKRKNEVKTTDNEKENDEKIEIYKPEELYPKLICTISLSVVALLTSKDVMSTIQENLPNKCVFVDEAEPVVNWRLNLPANDREEFSGLDQRLFVLKAEQLVNLVPGKPLNSSGRTLSEWFLSLGNATTSTHIVCYGLKKFKQLLKRNENRKYKNAVLGNDAKHQLKKNNDQVTISADDIPDIFVHIQLTYGVDVIVVENELEFVGLLSHITKAIAEAPLKRCQRKDVQFVQGNSVKVRAGLCIKHLLLVSQSVAVKYAWQNICFSCWCNL